MATEPFAAAGYGQREIGFGRRAAIVVVDFQLGFTDGRGRMARSPHIAAAVQRASTVLAEARDAGVRVIHTVVAYDGEDELGRWKVPGLIEFAPGTDAVAVDPRVLGEEDVVVVKRFPSAFFGTDVGSILRFWDVDTVVVMGCVTSGCIRATVIDSFSHGFRTIVAEDCCGDQDPTAHDSNLRDVGRRYADILPGNEIVRQLRLRA
jgi:maleamate amidohydrolase